jgi:hypothetical protein
MTFLSDPKQVALDFHAGKRLRDAGMQRVADNSKVDWKGAVIAFAIDWINRRPATECFTGEDIRLAAQAAGIEEPHHHNAWSSVIGGQIRSLLRYRVIECSGFATGKDPKAHARKLMLYRKAARPWEAPASKAAA